MFEICPYHDCTGCSACASICPFKAIHMQADEWGFKHPAIDMSLCVECGACKKVCPALQKPTRKQRLNEEAFYAAYHKDEEIRMQSSSGGAFTALAETTLQSGGAVCAAAFDEHCQNVRHILIEDAKDLHKLRTSKYTQSDMGSCFAEVKKRLNQGDKILFVGTPCQVSGLHLFLKKEYPTLTTADIVCHGVPSPRIFQDYISWLQNKHKNRVSCYNFRDKRWSWFHFNMKAGFEDGSTYYGTWEADPFFRGFLNDYFLRECCYSCQYSKHLRYADITLSDFWGYSSKGGGFRDDDKGISMCMCNTEKGLSLFRQACEHLVFCTRPREMSLANGGFSPRLQNLDDRTAFLQHYNTNGFANCIPTHFMPLPITGRTKLLYQYGRNSLRLKCFDFIQWAKSTVRASLPYRGLRFLKRKIFK